MRFNEDQFNFLALKAKESAVRRGYLYKSTGKKQSLEIQTDRLQKRWYALHYNLLFYYENQWSSKALGVILIEKSLCRRLPDTTVVCLLYFFVSFYLHFFWYSNQIIVIEVDGWLFNLYELSFILKDHANTYFTSWLVSPYPNQN